MKCVNCGIRIPDGMEICSSCGTKQNKLPAYYVAISLVLMALCLAYGVLRLVMGIRRQSWADIYKGAIACCAAIVFVPPIKFLDNNVAVLLIKLAAVAGVIIFV